MAVWVPRFLIAKCANGLHSFSNLFYSLFIMVDSITFWSASLRNISLKCSSITSPNLFGFFFATILLSLNSCGKFMELISFWMQRWKNSGSALRHSRISLTLMLFKPLHLPTFTRLTAAFTSSSVTSSSMAECRHSWIFILCIGCSGGRGWTSFSL